MFSSYVSPIARIFDYFNISYHQYADDTQLYTAVRSAEDTSRLLRCVEEVTRWFLINGLLLNAGKTEAIAFGPRQQLAKRAADTDLKIGDANVAIVESVKLLGGHPRFDLIDGQTGERSCQGMQFSYPCLATRALLFDARSGTNDLDRTRYLQIGLLQLPAVRHIRVEPRQAAAGSERFSSCGPASTLGMPHRPTVARSALAPHPFPNQIQSRPDDLQDTLLKGTRLSSFHTARLHSYSCVEIQRSTSSGKTEIIHRQGLESFQKLSSGGLEQLITEHSLCNLTREFQKTVEN